MLIALQLLTGYCFQSWL